MLGAARIGRLHKLYIEATANLATPTWVEFGKIQGGNRTGQRDVSEVKERDEEDTLVMLGHRNREITLTITKRPGNTEYDVLETASESGAKVGIAMMTGDITTTGERGYQAEMYVTGWDDDQAHDSTVINATLRPAADYTTAPDFVEIA